MEGFSLAEAHLRDPHQPVRPHPLKVAEILYPEGRWRADIARALGIGRSTLYRYLGRKRPARGIDDSLALLMARERIAAHGRGREIAKAERSFSRAMGRAPSPASKDSK